jgi:hypothetical protein
MPSMGYPFNNERNFSIMYVRIGTSIPISSDAKGSIMTEADELRKIPA